MSNAVKKYLPMPDPVLVASPRERDKPWLPDYNPRMALGRGRARTIKGAVPGAFGQGAFVIQSNPIFKLWTLAKPEPKKELAREETLVFEPSRNVRAARTFEDQQGGVALITQLQMDEASLARWYDQQANPDDYEPEVSTCEDCSEAIVFDLTMSGTITEWCPGCGWRVDGAVFERERRPAPGATGERSAVHARRRFWTGAGAGTLSLARRRILNRRTPDRIFVPREYAPSVLGDLHPKQTRGPRSRYAHIIEFARQGDPFVVPIPDGITAQEYQNKVRCALGQSRRTMYGKWSVGRVKEGLRIGLIGAWGRFVDSE